MSVLKSIGAGNISSPAPGINSIGSSQLSTIKAQELGTGSDVRSGVQGIHAGDKRLKQEVAKDDLEVLQESVLGIGAIPTGIRALIDSYSDRSDFTGRGSVWSDMDNVHKDLSNFVSVKSSRPLSNAFRPVYDFSLNSRFYELPKSKQREIKRAFEEFLGR